MTNLNILSSRLGYAPDLTTRQSRSVSVSYTSRMRVLAILMLYLTLGVGNAWGATTVTFTFNTDAGLSALGITKPAKSAGTELTANSPYTLTPVSMTVTHGGSTNTRVWNSNGSLTLRTYNSAAKHATITFSVSSAYYLTQVVITGGNGWNLTSGGGTYSSGTWTKAADPAKPTSMTLTSTANNTITTIAVTYETAAASCGVPTSPTNGSFR